MRTSARFAFANSVADITDDDDDDASRSTSPSRRDARVVVEPRARRRYPFVIVDDIVVDVELARRVRSARERATGARARSILPPTRGVADATNARDIVVVVVVVDRVRVRPCVPVRAAWFLLFTGIHATHGVSNAYSTSVCVRSDTRRSDPYFYRTPNTYIKHISTF
jgi:hypothetical protein